MVPLPSAQQPSGGDPRLVALQRKPADHCRLNSLPPALVIGRRIPARSRLKSQRSVFPSQFQTFASVANETWRLRTSVTFYDRSHLLAGHLPEPDRSARRILLEGAGFDNPVHVLPKESRRFCLSRVTAVIAPF